MRTVFSIAALAGLSTAQYGSYSFPWQKSSGWEYASPAPQPVVAKEPDINETKRQECTDKIEQL